MRLTRILVAAFALSAAAAHADAEPAAGEASGPLGRPNIIYILADDLGYGDVRALNADGKIATPHMDRLAAAGMAFTDAHSSSAVCTPTRYGILTGRYNWRTHLQNGVLGGFSRPLIPTSRMTVASMLKKQGYATACFGKWHLGMDWPLQDGGAADDKGNFGGQYQGASKIDWDAPIQNGPTALGFDTYYGISASADMPPYLFIRDTKVTEKPTVDKALWPGRKGPTAESFRIADILPNLAKEATAYIAAHADDAKAGKPFFIYMPLNSPHTPIEPSEPFIGKSGIGKYADFVMETDWVIGQVLDAIDKAGIADNTIVIVTSDNGCSPQANYGELAKHGHDPSYIFRGHKADIFEGGHRIPFIVRWPAVVKAGSTSDQTICLTDLMATAADVLGVKLPDDAGEDSVSILPALKGEADQPLREATVHHSINGSFSIRQGQWKLELCPDSGGWSDPRPGKAPKDAPPIQLFDLSSDLGEKHNVVADHPEIVSRLCTLLEAYVANGRSTPGAPQTNDVKVDMYKGHKPASN